MQHPPQSSRETVHELLQQRHFGVLATAGGDCAPYASLVAFAASKDDLRLFFITPRNTRKFSNISENSQVALLVDNSSNRPEDVRLASALTAVGRAAPVEAPDLEAARSRFMARHPNLKEFADSAENQLLQIHVERYILVERFQQVTEFRVQDAPPNRPMASGEP